MPKRKHLTRFTGIGVIVLVVAALVAAAFTATASAKSAKTQTTKHVVSSVSFADHYFSPDTLLPGDSTTLLLTIQQSGPEGSNAVITITGLNRAGLVFVSNGDSSAVCVVYDHDNTVMCTYTNAAHYYKSDSFTFASDPGQPLGTYHVHAIVSVAGVGSADARPSLTYTGPTSSGGGGGSPALPTPYVAPPSNAFIADNPGNTPRVVLAADAATELANANAAHPTTNPAWVLGFQLGGDNIVTRSGVVGHLVSTGPFTAGQWIGNMPKAPCYVDGGGYVNTPTVAALATHGVGQYPAYGADAQALGCPSA